MWSITRYAYINILTLISTVEIEFDESDLEEGNDEVFMSE